jgi:hypothetical protein
MLRPRYSIVLLNAAAQPVRVIGVKGKNLRGNAPYIRVVSCSYAGYVFISVAKHIALIRQQGEGARAGGSRASPLHPGPCHIRRSLRDFPHSTTAHHGRLRQASLPVSPERAVPGAFAYAPRLRSAPSMASTPVLTSPIALLEVLLSTHMLMLPGDNRFGC